jgi:natural product biosynthesis luciferase-like monooxygenase protein
MITLEQSFRQSCFSFKPFLSAPARNVSTNFRSWNLMLLKAGQSLSQESNPSTYIAVKGMPLHELLANTLVYLSQGFPLTLDFTSQHAEDSSHFAALLTEVQTSNPKVSGVAACSAEETTITVVVEGGSFGVTTQQFAEAFDHIKNVGSFAGSSVIAINSELALEDQLLWALFAYWCELEVVCSTETTTDELHENDSSFHMGFGVFFFGNTPAGEKRMDRYDSALEVIQYADQNGFDAVWTPERHFNDFGGLYPNPSVFSAAIAMKTERIQIRTGSIVAPHHHPARIAEDWALIDNLSGGRVALGFASGWQFNDFVFYPDHYEKRHDVMFKHIDEVRQLWRGEEVEFKNGVGAMNPITIYPSPLQGELPVWVTVSGKLETFQDAGRIGANILTHLLWQDPSHLKDKIAAYRQALEENGFDPRSRTVSVMVHTFVGDDLHTVKNIVRKPLKDYIESSVHLVETMVKGAGESDKMKDAIGRYGNLQEGISKGEMDDMLEIAFERFFNHAALLGDVDSCIERIKTYKTYDIDELACLIDFGVDHEHVMKSLPKLAEVKAKYDRSELKRYPITHVIATNKPQNSECVHISPTSDGESIYSYELSWNNINSPFFILQPNSKLAEVSDVATMDLSDSF